MKTYLRDINFYLIEDSEEVKVKDPSSKEPESIKAPQEVSTEDDLLDSNLDADVENIEDAPVLVLETDKVIVKYASTKEQAIEAGKNWTNGKISGWPITLPGEDNKYNDETFIEGKTFYFVTEKETGRNWLVEVRGNRDVRVWAEDSEDEDQTFPFRSVQSWFNSLGVTIAVFNRVQREPLELKIEDVITGKWRKNPDGTIDVDGDVDLSYKKLTKIPWQFGYVSGNFDCSWNDLTDLSNSPQTVDGNYKCSRTKIESCEGAPAVVNGSFYCSFNKKLKTLKGIPKVIGGNFTCSYNKSLQNLVGFPKEVNGNISCSFNTSIPSYDGLPEIIPGKLSITFNPLCKTLKGCPKKVEGDFNCSNGHLTDLVGGPIVVGGNYDCSSNDLASFKGLAKKIGGSFKYADNDRISIGYVKAFIKAYKAKVAE